MELQHGVLRVTTLPKLSPPARPRPPSPTGTVSVLVKATGCVQPLAVLISPVSTLRVGHADPAQSQMLHVRIYKVAKRSEKFQVTSGRKHVRPMVEMGCVGLDKSPHRTRYTPADSGLHGLGRILPKRKFWNSGLHFGEHGRMLVESSQLHP